MDTPTVYESKSLATLTASLTAQQLRITLRAQDTVVLNEHKGSALRGALFHALRGPARPAADGYTGFCTNKAAPTCAACPLVAVCPVSLLVSTLDPESDRGQDV